MPKILGDPPRLLDKPTRCTFIDLEGARFGRLFVLGYVGPLYRQSGWLCQCDCGAMVIASSGNLRSGDSASCRCLMIEHIKESYAKKAKYTGDRARLRGIWRGMISRCHNEKSRPFRWYGAKGVIVVDRWRNDFEGFAQWAFANGYRHDLTIERKRCSGNYCPENCCWIPKSDQSLNKSNTPMIAAFGETKTIPGWSRDPRCSVGADLLRRRIFKLGMPPEIAIAKPTKKPSSRQEKVA